MIKFADLERNETTHNNKMKNFFKAISAIAAIGAIALLTSSCNNSSTSNTSESAADNSSIAAGSIVYFNLDKVLEEYDMANDLRSVVETKVQSINEEVNRRGAKLQSDIQKFTDKVNKGLLTSSVAQAQQEKLQQDQANFQNYAAQKEQEIAEEQQVMMNQLADAIKTFVDKYNTEKAYAMIIACQGDILPAPVVTADPKLDITDDILAGLNAEYVQTKNDKSGK